MGNIHDFNDDGSFFQTEIQKRKRVGAKAAKLAERLQNPSEVLTGDAATSFRAVAARAND